MSKYAITGIKDGIGPNGEVPVRRELDEWWLSKDPKDILQRSLFVLALRKMMSLPPDNRLSYFALAGIHGQPLTSWDNVKKDGEYCVHGTPLFPPWHRPYLLLYEQAIYETMLQIIKDDFQNQTEYREAARTWRLPYWDWAMKKLDWRFPKDKDIRRLGPNVPFAATQKMVTVPSRLVDAGKSATTEVENPLWRYTLDDSKKTFGDYNVLKEDDWQDNNGRWRRGKSWNDCVSTSRHPQTTDPKNKSYSSEWVQGDTQNWQKITGELRGHSRTPNTLPEMVYRLYPEKEYAWNAFATKHWYQGSRPEQFSSLEDIHNGIHVYSGGEGHMGEVAVAAFDPLFWFHHNNIDRLFAIYQALFPNQYVTETRNPKLRETQGGPSVIRETDPLIPFSKDTKGTSFTSKDVRDHTKLGYTYPELQNWLPKHQVNGQFDQKTFEKNIRIRIEQLYSTTGKAVLELPEFEDLAQKHVASLNVDNLRVEQFSPSMLTKALETIQAPQIFMTNAMAIPSSNGTNGNASIASNGTNGSASITSNGTNGNASIASNGHETAPTALISALAARVPQVEVPKPKPALVHGTESWQDNDYIVNVLYNSFALNGDPFLIRIFLGDVPEGPPFYFEDTPTQVGLVYNFSGGITARGLDDSGCPNCAAQQAAGVLSTGQVILTDHLVQRITSHASERGLTLASLSTEEVTEYLKKNLHWRISDRRDNIVPKEQMPSLKVSVARGRATHYLEASRPSRYEEYEVLYEVTDGRLGGAVDGDFAFDV